MLTPPLRSLRSRLVPIVTPRSFHLWALVALLAALLARPAAGQVGATTDIITGTVTGPDSQPLAGAVVVATSVETDRKSTRLNSSHLVISYAVFCLKKKKKLKY